MRALAPIVLAVATITGAAIADAQPARRMADWPGLIDATAMRDLITTPRLRIIDLRDPAAYELGHADGAVSAPIESWYEAVRQDALPNLIGQAGIHRSRPILLVHDDTDVESFSEAAWVAWELKRRGVVSVSILEGGMAAWEGQGLRTTTRVHRHRTYNEPFDVDHTAAASQNEVAGIRLGVAEGELLEISADSEWSDIEGMPTVSLETLIGEGEGLGDRLELLDRLKNTPVSWQTERVVVFSDDPRVATAFWFLASEILGIRGVAVMPTGTGNTSVAELEQ